MDEEATRKKGEENKKRIISCHRINPDSTSIRESHGRVPDSSRNLTYPVARVPTLAFPLTEARRSFRFRGGPISWRGLLILFQNTVVVRHVTANWFRCRLGPSEALTLTFLEALVVGSSALPGGSIGPWHWLRDGSLVNMVIQALSLSLPLRTIRFQNEWMPRRREIKFALDPFFESYSLCPRWESSLQYFQMW